MHPHPKLGGFVASALLLISVVLVVLRVKPGIGEFIRSTAAVLGASFVFVAVGPILMMVNKYIMHDLDFPYPLSLSGWNLFVCGSFARGGVCCGFLHVDGEKMANVSGFYWFKRAMPIAISKAGTLACGNAAYLFLGVGLISMLKSFTPVWIVVLAQLAGLPSPSWSALLFLVPIVLGTAFLVHGDLMLSSIGLMLALAANLMEASSLVLTQKLLQQQKLTVTEGLCVMPLPGSLLLFTLAAVFEWPHMIQSGHAQSMYIHFLWFVASGVLGLVINFVGFLLLQVTNSLTTKLLSLSRNMSMVFIGAVIYKEIYTGRSLLGYAVSFSGFLGYFWSQADPDGSDRLLQRLVSCCCCSWQKQAQANYRHVGAQDVSPRTVGAVTGEEERLCPVAPIAGTTVKAATEEEDKPAAPIENLKVGAEIGEEEKLCHAEPIEVE